MRTGVEADLGRGVGAADERAATLRFGPTRFSVIPRTAVAKVSVRFVPNQDAMHVAAAIERHVVSEFGKLGSSNAIDVKVRACGAGCGGSGGEGGGRLRASIFLWYWRECWRRGGGGGGPAGNEHFSMVLVAVVVDGTGWGGQSMWCWCWWQRCMEL
eukprot:351538-Chlamydomonas_euryale.AAC.8